MGSTVDYQPLLDTILEDIKIDEEVQHQTKKPLKKKRKSSKQIRPITVIPTIQPNPTPTDVFAATQVFQLNQDVYVKEIAFYFLQNHTIRVWSFKPPFSLDCFQPIHSKHVNMQTNLIHKLPWNSGNMIYSAMYDIIHKITSTHNVHYYVQDSIPNPLEGYAHINLTKMGCPHPSFLKYEGGEMYCPIHQGLPGECAVLNVSKLGQWYKSLCQKIPSTPTIVAPTENTQAMEETITIPDTGLVYGVL